MIQRERLADDFEGYGTLAAPGEGINRITFTDADQAKIANILIKRMVDAGLTVGNKTPTPPPIVG